MLAHYTRVARRLWLRFQDEDASCAAFLHGVRPQEHELLAGFPRVTPRTLRLLAERNRIRSMASMDETRRAIAASEGSEISRLIVANVLPGITEVHAALIFVLEQLDHVDPREVMVAYTRAFAATPGAVPRVSLRDAEEIEAMRNTSLDGPLRVAFLRYIVGPVAEHIGLWQEAMAAQNLALMMENAQALAAIANCATSDVAWLELAEGRVQRVREMIDDAPAVRMTWEWHNPAAIAMELGAQWNHTLVRRRFDRTGYVAITCKNEADCYAILGRLHAKASFQRDAIRDFIGAPRLSGYRALHTVLTHPSADRRELDELTPVHLFTQAAADEHLQPSSREQLQRVARHRRTALGTLRAYAPDGRQIDLVPGSTVLNFALKVHQSFLPYLRSATVNRRPVPLTHRLVDGDVVWLEVDRGDPRPLPEDWEQHVPPSTRRRIRAAFRQAYRPTLIAIGREWLRERLGQRALLDDNLDAVLEEVEEERHAKPRGSDWMLRAFGIHALRERALETRAAMLDEDTIEAFLRAIADRCSRVAVRDELDLPPSLRRHVSSALLCTSCNAGLGDIEGTLRDGVLTVHRAGSLCAGKRFPIGRVSRRTQNQFFVVDAINRNGIVADILGVFRRHLMDICDVAARRMSAGWIVVRIGVDFSGVQRRDEILRELNEMPEVVKAVGPGTRVPPYFEHVLPARPLASLPFHGKASPFQAGSPVEDDRMFYGMGQQLQNLRREFEFAQSARFGRFVFVTGPLKTGKTSLVFAFLRSCDVNTSTAVLTHYSYAERAEWHIASRVVRDQFLESAAAAGIEPRDPGPTLEDAITAVRRATDKPIVLVIDEMVGLLRENTDDDAQIGAILRFHDVVRHTPKCMAIWIGPQAPARRLDPRLSNVLQGLELVAPPLTEEETASLLQASRLGVAHRIEVSSRLSRDIWRLTGGNPYWITELASIMYAGARRKPNGGISFDDAGLEQAKQTMFSRERVFLDRVFPPHDAHHDDIRSLKQSILHHLVHGQVELPAEALCERLQIRDPHRRTFNDALEDLRLGGTLSVRSDLAYTIQAPLLAEYLRYSDEIRARES